MFGIGTPELLVILLILLFLFGSKKLPELMKGIGESIKEFKKAMNINEDSKQKDSGKSKSKK